MNGLPNWQCGFTQKRVKGVTEMVIPYGARNDRIPKTGTRSKMSNRGFRFGNPFRSKMTGSTGKKVQPWQKVQRERGLSGSGQTAFGKPGFLPGAIRPRGKLTEKVDMAAHRRKYGRN